MRRVTAVFVFFLAVIATFADLVSLVAAAEPGPKKLAVDSRLDIQADIAVGSLKLTSINGAGVTVSPMTWLAEPDRKRSFIVTVPTTHLEWTEFSFSFIPENSGVVDLSLVGPWEEVSKGRLYQAEVLWDKLQSVGTSIKNGNFEKVAVGKPANWGGRGEVVAGDELVVPSDGLRCAKTWHDGRLTQRLTVQGGTRVTIKGQTRSASFSEMRLLEPTQAVNTPAHEAAKRFMKGINLGNFLEVAPKQNWSIPHSATDLQLIAKEGFDHVRIPIGWQYYTGPAPGFELSPSIFKTVDTLVREAEHLGLSVILNVHHFDEFTDAPMEQKDRFVAIWRQVAEHYAESSERVAFELFNEPYGSLEGDVLNDAYTEALTIVRKSNPERIVFVGPTQWNDVDHLPFLRLPKEDQRIILTVHCYLPFAFTHQGTTWSGRDYKVSGIRFPGPPDRPLLASRDSGLSPRARDWLDQYSSLPADSNPCGPQAFLGKINKAKLYASHFGRPVHFGEFGAYYEADTQSRSKYAAAFRAALDEAGIGWAYWDWRANFRYWNDKTQRPSAGLREGLFQKKG